ncbi:MAG: mechanosensitive ion channel [Caulobacteraceae bacterium]|nr:mechanosensitive ion channel [Caulobacteraceae bacterium]
MQADTDLIQRAALLFSGDRAMLATLVNMAGALAVNLVLAGIILAITLWLAGRLSKVARRAVQRAGRNHPPDQTLQAFIGSLVRYVVIAVGLIAVLQQLGVKATSVIAVLGAASLAIGLAVQGALSNVAAGVMLLLLRPYRAGDAVRLNDQMGEVKSMDLFSTRLVSPEGLDIFVPNGKVFGELLINYSTPKLRRFEWQVGIDYDDDVDLALRLLLEIAERDPRIVRAPAPWAKVTGLGESAVNLTLRAWAANADLGEAAHDTLKAIKQTFEAHGLTFPYPQQTASEREPKTIDAGPPAERR